MLSVATSYEWMAEGPRSRSIKRCGRRASYEERLGKLELGAQGLFVYVLTMA